MDSSHYVVCWFIRRTHEFPFGIKSSSFKEHNQENCDENLWIKVNVEQNGFYRVKYEDELAAKLKKAIENDCLSAADKFGTLDDTFALCQASKQSLSSLLLLMDAYRKELTIGTSGCLLAFLFCINLENMDVQAGSGGCVYCSYNLIPYSGCNRNDRL